MEQLLSNIVSYLDYLHKNCNLSVSVHFEEKILNSLPPTALSGLLKYNVHANPYCLAVKREHHGQCVSYQRNIIKSGTKNSFCSICHAGVYEYIQPILQKETVIGFIAVSGYRQTNTSGKQIDYVLWKNALSEQEIPQSLCDILLPPLKLMLEQLFERYAKETLSEYNMILQFLHEYHNHISLADLCSHFNRSKSYISHMFKQQNGKTLRAYCNDLKLADAKKLLTHTNRAITEIAFDVGFHDVSYFISLFKQKYGISPLKFRKKQTE